MGTAGVGIASVGLGLARIRLGQRTGNTGNVIQPRRSNLSSNVRAAMSFKLPDGVAPVPERGQLPTQPVAAPVGMLCQERPHLRHSSVRSVGPGSWKYESRAPVWQGGAFEFPNNLKLFLGQNPLAQSC